MKRCPECGRTFNDETLRFCLYDGKPLTGDTPPGPSPPPTQPYSAPPTPAPYAAPPPQYQQPPRYTAPPYGAAPKKSGWRWVGIIAGLLLLVRVGLHLANPVNPNTSPGTRPAETKPAEGGGTQPESSPPDTEPSESALRESLVSAIKQADTAQAQALSQADPAPLYTTYSGPALQRQIATVQTLKNTGITVEGHLLSQDFGTFHVNANQSEAQVETSENWSLSFYSAATHKLLRSQPSNMFVQSLFLKRNGDGWAINDSHDNK